MTETQRRIRAYKDALPGLRERVVAVALLLAMSMAMMTSASFAWLTISRRPEVTGVNTTIASNGNLEIALATKDGSTPVDSKVGDSSAADGQTVFGSNTTWGNLINLSDPVYGLDNLILRPAQLNTASLTESPLYGAVYGADGRITQLTSNFGYATWNLPTDTKPGYFGVSEDYGVRAISSTKIEAVGADKLYYEMIDKVNGMNRAAGSTYTSIANTQRYMSSLATMMGLYMTAKMNSGDAELGNPTCKIDDVKNLRDMYEQFKIAFYQEAEAMAGLVNLQQFLLLGEGNYEEYTADDILTTTDAALKADGLHISNLRTFQTDYATISSDYDKLVEMCKPNVDLSWKKEDNNSGLNAIVNNLVNVGTCTLDGKTVNEISSDLGAAAGFLDGETHEAVITNGVLYRFEERTGEHIQVEGLTVSAKLKKLGITVPASIKANITTSAPTDSFIFDTDMETTKAMNTGFKGGIPVAEDTYGLAIDFWVRTNAEYSYLTLEGNVLTKKKEINPTTKNADNEEVYLYTLTISGEDENGETTSYTIDVYPGEDEQGNTIWFNAESHMQLSDDELGGVEPIQKVEEVEYVVGYEGENRVWSEKGLSVDATTQGSGSCYVYYADSPEDQAKSLILLEAMNVAFVDQDGKLLTTATMDTDRHYVENGRVIVPLVLETKSSIDLGTDYQGNQILGITALEKNVPMRITAIVYLDGRYLTNEQVLAAADIQGQLNIQFGNSKKLDPIEDEELESKERKVTASLKNTKFDYDTHVGDMITNVTIHVDGDQPNKVTAFFVRAINEYQGTRETVMNFTEDANGDWVADYKFTTPGIYKLRMVQLDGVEYPLIKPSTGEEGDEGGAQQEEALTVVIDGFAVSSLHAEGADDNNHLNIRRAENSASAKLDLTFATSNPDKMPTTVQGRFLRDSDGTSVNVNFTYASGVWSGIATFLASGDYTMQYLVLDGKYMELQAPTEDSPGMWQTASVTLGMRVEVSTTSPTKFTYKKDQMAEDEAHLGMKVKIFDNEGKEMPGMSGVKLKYIKGVGQSWMDTDLIWDGTYYSGELLTTGPGTWKFGEVTIGEDDILKNTTGEEPPVFIIQTPEPPAYFGHRTIVYQYSPSANAVMTAQITNSNAAEGCVLGEIKKSDGTTTWVSGVMGGDFKDGETTVTNWSFAIPKDVQGYQDGHWTLTQIKIWNVFSADGKEYTEAEPLVLEIPAEEENKTKVVCRVYPTFAVDKSQNFGKTENNVTAGFMTSHTISGLDVSIVDFEGKKVEGVTDVQLKFTYTAKSSETNGGYKMVNSSGQDILTNATEGATITVPLVLDTSTNYPEGTHFVQNTNATILYAGNYVTELSFKIKGVDVTYGGSTQGAKALPAKAPVFTVWSVKPYAKITNVYTSKTTSINTKLTWTGSLTPSFTASESKKNTFSDYAATLYASATTDNSTIGNRHGFLAEPKLTITVYGVATGYTATLKLPAGSASEVTFERTGNGSIEMEIGVTSKYKSFGIGGRHYVEAYAGHGNVSITTMTLTKDGVTYTVTLDNSLAITNPSSVNQG